MNPINTFHIERKKPTAVTLRQFPDIMSVANCDDTSVIDFPIKRVYYIYDVPKGVERGGHAHRELRQMLFCPHGSIRVSLDDGLKKTAYVLNKADVGLFVDRMVWHTMDWLESGSILCVAASDYYDEGDYIRDYDSFENIVSSR